MSQTLHMYDNHMSTHLKLQPRPPQKVIVQDVVQQHLHRVCSYVATFCCCDRRFRSQCGHRHLHEHSDPQYWRAAVSVRQPCQQRCDLADQHTGTGDRRLRHCRERLRSTCLSKEGGNGTPRNKGLPARCGLAASCVLPWCSAADTMLVNLAPSQRSNCTSLHI